MPPALVHVWDAELGYSHVGLESRPDGGPVQVDPSLQGAEPMWGVWMTDAGGGKGVHIFPHATLEWRAAEYAIDPDDIDTLLDVVLHCGAIPDPADPLAYQDPAQAAILTATHGMPTAFTPGVPPADRRAAILERIRLVKEHRVRVEPAPQSDRAAALAFVGSRRPAPSHPLDPIRTQARIDPIRVAGKRAFLDWRRASLAGPARPTFHVKPPATFVGTGVGQA